MFIKPRSFMLRRKSHVRFTPESGHVQRSRSCLLWARSGHRWHYSITSSARPTSVLDTGNGRERLGQVLAVQQPYRGI